MARALRTRGSAPILVVTEIMGLDSSPAILRMREDPGAPVFPAPGADPSPSLEALMLGYQQADEVAARSLIEQVSPMLFRFFWVQAFGRRYADDLLQETWMRVHKARHTYRQGEPVLPWIFAIARHTGFDNYRKARRVEVREAQVEALPEMAAADPRPLRDAPDIDAILGTLPESQREVLVMLKVSGMSLEEVARATCSSVGSVKQKAHRAYRKLRDVVRGVTSQ